MKTLKVDGQKRIRIPDAIPKQVFAYENHGDGSLTLTLVKPVKTKTKERRPTSLAPLSDKILAASFAKMSAEEIEQDAQLGRASLKAQKAGR